MMKRLRVILLPTAAALCGLAVLVSLGTWQLQRKGQKEALIAMATARANGEARPLWPRDAWARLAPDAVDFSKVRVTGTFLPGETQLYGIRDAGAGHAAPEPGWFVFAPLAVKDGGVVLVDRGFVPMALKDPANRPDGARPPVGEVSFEAIARKPEIRGLFSVADDPARDLFYTRDPQAFAARLGIEAAPFTVDQLTPNPGGLPAVDPPRIIFPNNHLEYAITWYGLALTLAGVWAASLRGASGPPEA